MLIDTWKMIRRQLLRCFLRLKKIILEKLRLKHYGEHETVSAATGPSRNGTGDRKGATSPEVWVILPDFFQCFLKDAPPVNPYYETVRVESENWLNNFCDFPTALRNRIHKCDFSYFCAIVAPYAQPWRFRILCDWGNWVFPYDDMFDVEGLVNNGEECRRIMKRLLDPFSVAETPPEKRLLVVEAHDDIAFRMFSECSSGIKARYMQSMEDYASGVLAHVADCNASQNPSLEAKIEARRKSAGVSPLYHLAEHAHDLVIPDKVFEDPVIQELEVLGMDMVAITNDILSYRKEEPAGIPDNIIATCRLRGMSAQEAFDVAGKMLQHRYSSWERAEASVKSWGQATDIEVGKYIDAIKAVVKANLYWSFRSDRYLGRDANQVRRDRRINVLETPPYLKGDL